MTHTMLRAALLAALLATGSVAAAQTATEDAADTATTDVAASPVETVEVEERGGFDLGWLGLLGLLGLAGLRGRRHDATVIRPATTTTTVHPTDTTRR